MKDNNKKNKIIVGVSLALIVILVITATYAYLASKQDKSKSTDIKITADTTDTLVFKSGKELTFKATSENLKQGGSNLSATTDVTAILRANSTNNQSTTFHYNVYLLISENTFDYTINAPELIFSIKGPDGDVKKITNLTYYPILKGFDVTIQKGLYTIATNREISTTDMLEEKWEATITLLNIPNANQAHNGGASFKARLIITSEELTLSDYVKLAYEAAPNGGITYHDENLANGAEDYSYRYSGPTFKLTKKAKEAGAKYIYFNSSIGVIHSESNTNPNIVYLLNHDTSKTKYTMIEALQKATTDGYLEEGLVNNYVCFGSDASTCPEDNLYQIIGAFKVDDEYRVKLIKATNASEDLLGMDGARMDPDWGDGIIIDMPDHYFWNVTNSDKVSKNSVEYKNVWSTSSLNKVNLNTNYINYLNNINSKWASSIATSTWIVGGFDINKHINSNAKTIYNAEITNPNNDVETTTTAKIGLMYASDTVYSLASEYWDLPYNKQDAGDDRIIMHAADNWLVADFVMAEWTITRGSTMMGGTNEYSQAVTTNQSNGAFSTFDTDFVTGLLVRPTFYLNSDTKIYGGSGTINDPYRIFETI